MILDRIVLTDFKNFYGECTLDFYSDNPKKNVTIIRAENGVGKTTILNSLLWCFYNITTDGNSDNFVNYQARSEGRELSSVMVEFYHNEALYTAIRSNVGNKSSNVQVTYKLNESNVKKVIDAPEVFLNTVIPREMAGHFFFDGEAARVTIETKDTAKINKAVLDILGATIVKVAINDLESAYQHYRKAAGAAHSDKNVRGQQETINMIQTSIERDKASIDKLEMEIATVASQSETINSQLRNTKEVKELQRRKERLEEEVKRITAKLTHAKSRQQKWLSDYGTAIVAKKLIGASLQCLDADKTEERISGNYSKDFVESILREGVCACGREIGHGSQEEATVKALLGSSVAKIVVERSRQARSRITSLRDNFSLAVTNLNDALKAEVSEEESLIVAEAQLEEVRAIIVGIDIEGIARKERQLFELRSQNNTLQREIGTIKTRLVDSERRIKDTQRDIDMRLRGSEQAKRLLAPRDLAEAVKIRAEERLTQETRSARGAMNAKMTEIFNKVFRKDYKIMIKSNFSVAMTVPDIGETAPSAGEAQILGLAFTAALCDFAKVRKNSQDDMLLPGTEAPLVLDAPFGQLDSVYKQATAEFLPNMARQVIIMVSSSQGTKDVMEVFKGKVSNEYVLIYHSKESQGERKTEMININGQDIEITRYGSTFDGTEVRVVKQS